MLINQYERQQIQDKLLDSITHIFFEGLHYGKHGKIEIGNLSVDGRSEDGQILLSAETYIPWLCEIKRLYPHISLIWCLPPDTAVKHANQFIDPSQFFRMHETSHFSDQLYKLASDNPIDGYEFNFNLSYNIAEEFAQLLKELDRFQNFVTLPVNSQLLYENFKTFVSNCQQYVTGFIVNCFGFLKHRQLMSQRGAAKSLIARNESSIADSESLLHFYNYYVDEKKIFVGVDTCGVHFVTHPNSEQVEKFKMIPFQEIHNMIAKDKGMEEKSYTVVMDNLQAPLLKLKEGDGCNIVSFDSDEVKLYKIEQVLTQNYGGIVIGDLKNDVSFISDYSMVQMAFKTYKAVGLNYKDSVFNN